MKLREAIHTKNAFTQNCVSWGVTRRCALLLELYPGFPIWCNVHSSDYKKRNIRIIYLRKIQERLLTTIPSIKIEDVKEKLQKLPTQNQKQLCKIRSSSRIGVWLEDVYKPMLWFYEKMSFLDDNELRPTVSTLNVETLLEENLQNANIDCRVSLMIYMCSWK